jgi:hypothetical protein
MSTLIAEEVYIRIADDQAGFVCTVKYGKFSAMVTEFALHWRPTPDGRCRCLQENAPRVWPRVRNSRSFQRFEKGG